MINCLSPAQSTIHSETITIAGNDLRYVKIVLICLYTERCSTFSIKPEYHCQQATSSTNMATSSSYNGPTDCVFNYTINITTTSSSSSSCSMTVYSSNTSLILTDLLTSGQNYSFAVAVTDSTGQHGPWSDQFMVTYDGS